MLEKLESLEAKYEELNKKLGDPEVIGDPNAYKRLAKAHAELEEIVNEFRSYKSVLQDLEDARAMLREDNDPEFTAMLRDEVDSLESRQEELERRLQILLLPKDAADEERHHGDRWHWREAALPAPCFACTPAMQKAAGTWRL